MFSSVVFKLMSVVMFFSLIFIKVELYTDYMALVFQNKIMLLNENTDIL